MSFLEHRFTSRDALGLYHCEFGDPASTATPAHCLAGLFRNARDFDPVARSGCSSCADAVLRAGAGLATRGGVAALCFAAGGEAGPRFRGTSRDSYRVSCR